MKTEIEIINDIFSKQTKTFTKNDVIKLMNVFANQFKWIKTTCGKSIEFDDIDYELLRGKQLFINGSRGTIWAVWKLKNGKKTVSQIVKLLLDLEGKTVVRYKDGNKLNIRRNNLELITHQKAHFKQIKQKTSSGNKPSSIYKGVSFNKFANKWKAGIKANNEQIHLGYFVEEINAAKAYNEAAIKYFGKDYSELNILPSDGKK